MIKKLTNYLINKYEQEKKKKIDELYSEQLKELKLLFDKRTIRQVLWEMTFEYDFKQPINLKERYRIYSKLNGDGDFVKLFKSKYFKNNIAYIHAVNDEERDILKGRMLEIEDTIKSMIDAKHFLDNWEQIEKLEAKKIKLKSDIREKILITN